jgi:lysophospholipase L1-like esterase
MTTTTPRPSLRICFFGDSFVLGLGDPEGLGWVGRACARARREGLDLTAYNLGVRRDTSADVLQRFAREAQARLPSGCEARLVFSFGANDCASEGGGARLPLAALRDNAERILRQASALAPTLMLGPLPISDDAAADARIAEASELLAPLCARLQVPYLPLLQLAQGSPVYAREAAAGDGTHPGAESYALLADAIEAWPAWRAALGLAGPARSAPRIS